MTKVIAVDLGGTNLRVSLVNNNKIIKYVKKDTPKEVNLLLNVLEESIGLLITKDVKGIGIGSPGPLDAKTGVIKNPPNLPFKNFNLKKHLEKKFKKKVFIENDVHCVAIAESKLGVKKKNFIVIAFGTGIGGGIIIDGKLYSGKDFAGELGHIVVDKGMYFEKLWQESREKMKEEFGENILIKDLINMKNPKAEELTKEIISYIGKGLGSIINIFDPEVLVINGGFKEAGNKLLDMIKKETKKYSVLPHENPIIFSNLDHPGTLGASLLVK